MIDLSIKRPVATAAIYVALVALGAYSFRLIPVELLPDVDRLITEEPDRHPVVSFPAAES